MKKPYIICHMMTSIDGRIDCAMTAKLPGVDEYYETLDALNIPTNVTGRVTAMLEMAAPGKFQPKDPEMVGKPCWSKKCDSDYTIVVDTKGTLLWDGIENDPPLLVACSEQVSKEYLDYLDRLNVSWIACGKSEIDLDGLCGILTEEFGVQRLGVVGGSAIDTAFLQAGLLDEISILLAPGIDGRGGMKAVFDHLPREKEPTVLQLADVKAFPSGAVWLRYRVP